MIGEQKASLMEASVTGWAAADRLPWQQVSCFTKLSAANPGPLPHTPTRTHLWDKSGTNLSHKRPCKVAPAVGASVGERHRRQPRVGKSGWHGSASCGRVMCQAAQSAARRAVGSLRQQIWATAQKWSPQHQRRVFTQVRRFYEDEQPTALPSGGLRNFFFFSQ